MKKKYICACGRKVVYFNWKGKTKADRKHTLCQRCYRDHRNKTRPKDHRRKRKKQ